MIKIIPIDQAEPGMLLGQPVYDSMNRILLNRGEILSEDKIERLLRLGVKEMRIRERNGEEGAPEAGAGEVSGEAVARDEGNTGVVKTKEEIAQEIVERVDARFANVASNDLNHRGSREEAP